MKHQIHYVGREITIKVLKDYILDNDLTEDDTILLNPNNFDDIVIEYRKTYFESINLPYYLLGVYINEDKNGRIPIRRIGTIKDDPDPNRTGKLEENELDPINKTFDFYDMDIVFRCNYCGNVVDEDGNVLEGYERVKTIDYINNSESPIVHHKEGKCCPNKH